MGKKGSQKNPVGGTYFKAWHSIGEDFEELPAADYKRAMQALFRFSVTLDRAAANEPLSHTERVMMRPYFDDIEQDMETYAATVEINRMNGAKGGRPRKNP